MIHLKIVIQLLFCFCFSSEQIRTNWWHKKAEYMVKEQLERRGIQDKGVLRVMRETPRHDFIPENMKEMAYDDGPLPIGEGQTISQPYIVALMTELLELEGNEKVLEIGTGSGYQSAVLSTLVQKVYSIEIVQSLAEKSAKKLREMKYHNVTVKWGDGYKGWIEYAPFDAIIVTAAPNEVPQALIDQLKIGGRLVLPVGTRFQKLKVITKIQDEEFSEKNIISVRFVPMVHSNKIFSDSIYYKIKE